MTSTTPPTRTAIVIGGSMAGMLAAAALSTWAQVTVIDHDVLPEGPTSRKGLPQGRHVHLLWSGGAAAIEALLPGTMKRIHQDGVHKVPLPTGMVALSPEGWFRRWRESHYIITGSRDRIDWHVREQVSTLPGVTILDRTDVLAFEGSAERVTGVRVRTAGETADHTLTADIVVDASGRSSRTPRWLTELGLPAPAERTVDAGLVYSSRIYRAPTDLGRFPVVINVQADPHSGGPGQSGVVVPIEDDQWLVTIAGTRGGEPTAENEDFADFAGSLRHPVVGHIVANAEPLTDVVLTRTTANHRRFYEKASMPEGLIVIGDAAAAYNPVYGHGMSVAAKSALAMKETISRYGWALPGMAHSVQKAIAKPVAEAWALSTGQDVFYSGATPDGPTGAEKAAAAYVRRLIRASTGSGRVARAVTDVMTLEKPAFPTLFAPDILLAALRGPQRHQLTRPPLTTEEREAFFTPRPVPVATEPEPVPVSGDEREVEILAL
ncbi:FAD-dependent monooxygenase [Streptomyces sp. NPDC097619]|uniref:NAD(P)/FAD-dependent oxidoreductase n=1 Tax=Streptomyces sp. NPDC097619 TaxID=3157228 RepID=UPI003316868B